MINWKMGSDLMGTKFKFLKLLTLKYVLNIFKDL